LELEGENVNDHIRFAVQQNDVAADQDMCAIGWGRRQPTLQLNGSWIQTLLEARRKCSVANELLFESGRQAILLGKAGR